MVSDIITKWTPVILYNLLFLWDEYFANCCLEAHFACLISRMAAWLCILVWSKIIFTRIYFCEFAKIKSRKKERLYGIGHLNRVTKSSKTMFQVLKMATDYFTTVGLCISGASETGRSSYEPHEFPLLLTMGLMLPRPFSNRYTL